MARNIEKERCKSKISPLCTGGPTPRDIENGGMFRSRGVGGCICEHCDLHGYLDPPDCATNYLSGGQSSLAGMEDLAPGYGMGPSPQEFENMNNAMKKMGIHHNHESQKNWMFASMTPIK